MQTQDNPQAPEPLVESFTAADITWRNARAFAYADDLKLSAASSFSRLIRIAEVADEDIETHMVQLFLSCVYHTLAFPFHQLSTSAISVINDIHECAKFDMLSRRGLMHILPDADERVSQCLESYELLDRDSAISELEVAFYP